MRLEFLQNESNLENTRSSYLGTVKQFHAWYEQTFGLEFTKLYRENVLEFLSYLRNIKLLSSITINTKISALTKYNAYLSAQTGQEQVIFEKDYLPVQTPYANPCTVNRSDTLYCDRTSPNDRTKTCKEYGAIKAYQDNLKYNEAMGLYRKIYMQKQMMSKRNPDIKEYRKNFEEYKIQSKQWKKDVKQGKKTEAEYIEWLKAEKEKKVNFNG